MSATSAGGMPRRAEGLGWTYLTTLNLGGQSADAWIHLATSTQVLSSLQMAEQPRSGTTGPQWHVSIVDRSEREPRRPSSRQVALARCAFGMLEAEEDNHHPGAARQFWMPLDPSERVDCECKTEEVVVREADGFEWTNPKDGACRGCDLERAMQRLGSSRPCPIHRGSARPGGAPSP